ncbi:MAG: DUF4870 domain-containing protein [Candidatus Eremiobacteraeota bacterium]|nr:DUF4870 domain-containing protein [Candidatus Eremiobacteraeota bacterium]
MQAAGAARPGLRGRIGPSNPPPPSSSPSPSNRVATRGTALATVSGETRILLALGYVLWPLAALALLDPTRSRTVRRQALQALGLNFGLFALWVALEAVAQVPLLGWSAFPLLAALFPLWLIASLIYGVRVWNAESVRVPLVSDWLDQREARRNDERVAA